MSKHLQINPGDDATRALSKAQKRFNRLVEEIRDRREGLKKMAELDAILRRLGTQRIRPTEKKTLLTDRTFALALHHSPYVAALPRRQSEKLDAILVELLGDLLQTFWFQEDAELRQLFVLYADGRSFEDMQAEAAALARIKTSAYFNDLYDLDLEPDELGNAEKVQEKLNARQAESEEAARARAERQAKRKKTPAQLEREAKQAAAAAALKKTIKQIYLDLVRYFHPDRERDEAKRLAKTETMKLITAAYEADDHLQLLELQMTLLSDRDNVFAEFDDTQLAYFNNVLQQQVYELDQQIALAHPANSGNPYARFFAFHPRQMEHNIGQYLRQLDLHQRQTAYTLGLIRTEKGLRAFVDDYTLNSNENDLV